MRLRADTFTAEVAGNPGAMRPVVLHLGPLLVSMTTAEARALADQLHDTAEAEG